MAVRQQLEEEQIELQCFTEELEGLLASLSDGMFCDLLHKPRENSSISRKWF